MKWRCFRWIGGLILIALAFLPVDSDAWAAQRSERIVGVDYAPPCEGQTRTDAELRRDLPLIKQMANYIRTFTVSRGQDQIPRLAARENLSVVPTAWLDSDLATNDSEIETLIAIANTNSNVAFVSVGSGTLHRDDLTEAQLLDYISRVRQRVSVPVTTAEPWSTWRDNPDLASAFDLIFVKVSPYIEGEPVIDAYVVERYNEIKAQYPDKLVIISGTGWPHDGQAIGAAVPSLANQQQFIRELSTAARSQDISYFLDEAFDELCEAKVGARWGLFAADRASSYNSGSAVTARWIGGSGNWSDPTHWDIGVVPNNSGSTSYAVIIDLPSMNVTVTIDQTITVDSLTNAETIVVANGSSTISTSVNNRGTIQLTNSNASLTVSGTVANTGDISATAGIFRFSNATVSNAGRTITADGGIVEIAGSTHNGGVLRATDNANSFVQFSGDVTLNNVTWVDPGAGVFRIYGTTARLLGDYAQALPAGYTLIIQAGLTGWCGQGPGSAQLNLLGGVFQNNGTIELRGGYGCNVYGSTWPNSATLNLESAMTLAGTGRVRLSTLETNQDQQSAQITGSALTVGETQTIEGRGSIQVDVTNNGRIEADQPGWSLTISQLIQNAGTLRSSGAGLLALPGGLANTGLMELVGSGSTITLGGAVNTGTNLVASGGGIIRFSNATVLNAGHTITADAGVVEIVNSTINGGALRATDNANSFVQFSGDVTLNGVTWDNPGAGMFRVFGTTARLLGDYAHALPAGYTLVVQAGLNGYCGPGPGGAQLNLPGGTFQNDGTIKLRGGYGCSAIGSPWQNWATLDLESGTTLGGGGRVRMLDAGWQNTARIAGAALTVGAAQTIAGRGEIDVDVVNNGKIEADQNGLSLMLLGSVINNGIVSAINGGALHFDGALTWIRRENEPSGIQRLQFAYSSENRLCKFIRQL
jgi:exo-beta-1,3-glucanase (GH17 family)